MPLTWIFNHMKIQAVGHGKHRSRARVITWKSETKLTYSQVADITPDITDFIEGNSLIRIDSQVIWHPGNILAKSNWEKLGDQ